MFVAGAAIAFCAPYVAIDIYDHVFTLWEK